MPTSPRRNAHVYTGISDKSVTFLGPMWASAPTAWLEEASKNRDSMRIHDRKQRRSIEKEQADWLALSAAW